MKAAPVKGRFQWTIGDYADHACLPMRTALRRVLRAHEEALARGAGGWLFRARPKPGANRLRTWWLINVEMMREQAPHMMRPESLPEQVAALREEHDELVERVERLSKSQRGIGDDVGRLYKRVKQLELPFSKSA